MTDHTATAEKVKDAKLGAKNLRKISIFAYLNEPELESLYSLGEIQTYKPKANIVIEGEPSRGLFVIVSGTVSVYKKDSNSSQLIRLSYLEDGGFFGELSLFDDAPRTATITAESACSCLFLDHAAFHNFLDTKGDNLKARFYQKCAEEMTERFRTQNTDYIVSQHLLWKYALRKE